MASSNNIVQEFLETICGQIKYKSIHKSIADELSDHIEDQKNTYIKQGMDEESAALKAVKEMGDPVLVGRQLDKAHRPRTEWSILLLAAVLVIIGGTVQYALSTVGSPTHFYRYLFYAPIGTAAFLLTYFCDYTIIARYSKLVYLILICAAVVGFFIFSPTFGTYTHVYYFALIFIPVFAGVVYSLRNKGYLGIVLSGVFYLGAAVLCILAPRFSVFVFLTISCLIILTAAVVKGYFVISKKAGLFLIYTPTVITSMLLIIYLFAVSRYNIYKISVMLNPQLDPNGMGWQHLLVKKLVASSQLFGKAVLEGDLAHTPIEQLLPGWYSDFTLTYIIAKWGYAVGLIIAAVVLLFIIRMFISIIRQKNAGGFLIAFSAVVAITGQVLFCVQSNLGLIIRPLSAGNLPFISYGGAGFIVNMILLGLVLSVYRHTDIISEKLERSRVSTKLLTFEKGRVIIDLGTNSSEKKHH